MGMFAHATAVTETVIALAPILGMALKAAHWLTGLFGLLVWSTTEGCGGPHTAGSTDVGTGISTPWQPCSCSCSTLRPWETAQ